MTKPLVAVAIFVVIAAWVGRVYEGRRSIEAADAAIARTDWVEAIVYARAAAEARCPWCSAPETGYLRLEAIASAAERRADDATAIAAWRAVRASTLATTAFDRAPQRRLHADAEIARFAQRIDRTAAAAGAAASPAASEARLRAALETTDVPSASVFAFLAAGGALFVFGASRLARAFRKRELALAVAGALVAATGLLMF